MKRKTVKEIIAFALYMRRQEMAEYDITVYGTAETDQENAERIIKFFESEPMDGWEYKKTYEDYRMFQGLCEEINDTSN